MELKTVENDNGHYKFIFHDETDEKSIEIFMDFHIDWKLKFKYKIDSKPVPYPFDFKKLLASVPIHIPKATKRYFFKQCMDYLIKETDMPAHVTAVEHPGYPLIVVTFNPRIIEQDKLLKYLENILDTIEAAKVVETEKEIPEKEEVDPLDEIDEDNVVEFEFDDEIELFKEFHSLEPDNIEKVGSGFSDEILKGESEGDNDD